MKSSERQRTIQNPMVVISLDAVGTRDLPFLKSLPNFGRFWEEAAVCERVKTVYPSLTYPAHTSIVTGMYPDTHGIVNNLQIQPEREKPDWFWQRRYVQAETLYDQVRKKGGTAASLLWPVTGGAKIRFNLPEILPNRPWQTQTMVSCLNGSPLYELELQRLFGHIRKGVSQPALDDFVQASLLHTLERYRPDLTLVHFTDVDTNRHLYGVTSPQAKAALKRHDQRIGEVLGLLSRSEWGKRANVVLLGDHYQLDVERAVCPNYYFAKRRWLTVRDGRIADWRVLARECDGSCYIYIKERTFTAQVYGLLEELREKGLVKAVYTGKEAAAMGADRECAFMVDGGDGVYFLNDWKAPAVREAVSRATHGFHPDRDGYTTIFGGRGPAFARGGRQEEMCLVDEGPTLAAALGVSLGRTDGEIKKNLLFISSDRVYNRK